MVDDRSVLIVGLGCLDIGVVRKKAFLNRFHFFIKFFKNLFKKLIQSLMTTMQKLSKETTVQYLVTLLDDMLQESKQRVELFNSYSKKYKENIYAIFQKMLYRNDPFITHQICRIITKIAAGSHVSSSLGINSKTCVLQQ
jgi:hypothetical protein